MYLPYWLDKAVYFAKSTLDRAPLVRSYQSPKARHAIHHGYRYLKANRWAKAESLISKLPTELQANVIGHIASMEKTSTLFSRWASERPNSWISHTVLAANFIEIGYRARGTGWSSSVSEENAEILLRRMKQAGTSLITAIKLNSKTVVPFTFLIQVEMISNRSIEHLWKAFAIAGKREPNNFQVHSRMVYALSEKWRGEPGEAIEFAMNASKQAPLGSAIHSLVCDAHAEAWFLLGFEANKIPQKNYFQNPVIKQQIIKNYEKTVCRPMTDFGHIIAMNSFAFCFYLMGEKKRARQALRKGGTRFLPYPWNLIDTDEYFYDEVVEELLGVSLG
ncbi:hypothetical protein [Reinekea sp. G2M2-21]|uniref:hypothetical protein n=1 Tax=Reinekea sp. G2M2-21 TaxID=2788942 RepID=UPI0018A8ECF2|nr:hypothetical protein [Reinekea sp. G2M2-21]